MAASTDPAEAMRGDIPTQAGHRSLFETILPPLRRIPTRWKMIVRGIGRSKRRSLATILGTVIALVLVLASWGMIDTIVILIDRQFNEVQLDDGIAILDSAIGPRQITDVRDVDGVRYSEKVLSLSVSAKGADDTYATQVFGYYPDTKMHGFLTENGELPPEGVVAGSALGEIIGAEEGDTVTLDFPKLDTEFTVKIAEFVDEPLGTLIYMDQDALVEAMRTASTPIGEGRLNEPGTAVIMTRFEPDVADREVVFEEIEDVSNVIATSDTRGLYILIEDYLGLFYLFVGMMLVAGGLLAFALIFNTTSANLAERAGEFANMRANGVSNREIAKLITGENLLLTALGIPPGLLAGYAVAALMLSSYSTDLFAFDLEMKPESLLYASLAMLLVAFISVLPGIRGIRRLDLGKVVRERAQ
jgi:putative ABC transport system permease protein